VEFDKDFFYAAGIVLTFLFSVGNLIFNLRSARRASFINTVTSQRVKWIEQLRQDVATYVGLTYTWSASRMEGKPQEFEMVKEIDRLRRVIRLRLNPLGRYDKQITALLEDIPKYTDPLSFAKLSPALDELTMTTQLLLKKEWEKVKDESEKGRLAPDEKERGVQ
jgi:hypothetical protein